MARFFYASNKKMSENLINRPSDNSGNRGCVFLIYTKFDIKQAKNAK